MKKGTIIDTLTGVFAVIGLACIGYLGIKYGEPATPKTPPRRDYRDYGKPYWRSEPVHYSDVKKTDEEEPCVIAIDALLKEAKRTMYASSKIKVANQISDLVSEARFPSDKIKMAAINALNDISATMMYASDRAKITELIAEIAVM
jgi:hypothetical protein